LGEVEEPIQMQTDEGLRSVPVGYFMKAISSVDEEDPIKEAARIMAEENIGSVVVCDPNGVYVGMVTERDIVRTVAKGVDSKKIPVKDIMSSPVITINEAAPIAEAIRTMVREKIRRLPITRGSRIVGIITQTDIQRAILEILSISPWRD